MSDWQAVEGFLTAFDPDSDDIGRAVDGLVSGGYIALKDTPTVRELLEDHWGQEWYHDDDDGDYHCMCGKWLERGYYEWEHHLALELDDLLTDKGKQ